MGRLPSECKLDRNISTIDNTELAILNDLCIPIGSTFFQIDSLILSRYLALIIEVKNISGPLEIDGEFEQMSRMINGEIIAYSNPVAQAKRYKIHLNQWMHTKKLPSLPIEFLVVFTHSSSIINSNSVRENHEYKGQIIKIESFVAKYVSLKKCYNTPHLTAKELKKVSSLLKKDHTQYIPNPVNEEIISGVQCTSCFSFSMIRNKCSWFCTNCEEYDRNAHIQAIQDFLLLKGPTINNRKAREFLGIDSPKVIHRLLNGMNLNVQGKGKGRSDSLQSNFTKKLK